MALTIGVTAFVAREPHYDMLMSGLGANESAKVMKALSEAGIPFRVSHPPEPFVVYVDEGDQTRALAAAYGAGALDRPLKGILAGEGGMSNMFMSSDERAQITRKREWEEMEKILEAQVFVTRAQVRTAAVDTSPFASRQIATATASVLLHIKNRALLDSEQAQTVAMLVSRGLGIAEENLMISDQLGRTIHDGSALTGEEAELEDWMAHKERYDRTESAKANLVLAEILGPNKARVVVDSQWNFEQSTTTSYKTEEGTITSETKITTETPIGNGETPSGAAGTASNVLDIGDPNARGGVGDPTATMELAEPLVAKSSEEKTEYEPSQTTTQTVRTHPVLERLSVALFLDDSIADEKTAALVDAVKAAVGYDELRGDNFPDPVKLTFALPEEDSGDNAIPEEETGGEMSPMVQTLLRRGVEILSALVFIVLLLKALKSARKGGGAGAPEGGTGPSVDPERLAQVQLEDMIENDPKRVAEVLSKWAREEQKVGAGR